MMRQKWKPQQVAAGLGAQMAQWGAAGCWKVDAEWSGWSARSRWRADSADCQNHIRPLRSTTSRGRSQSARVPTGLWNPRGRKKARERCEEQPIQCSVPHEEDLHVSLTNAGRHHSLVVVGVDTHVVALEVKGKLAAFDVLQLILMQVRPAPQARIDDVGEAFTPSHL